MSFDIAVAVSVGAVLGITLHAWVTERMWHEYKDRFYKLGLRHGQENAELERGLAVWRSSQGRRSAEVPRA